MAKAKGQLASALTAGAIAIVANTLALKAADFVPLATAKGGLLRLIRPWFAPVLKSTGIAHAWSKAGGPAVNTPLFQTGFHLAVGLLMALVYAYILEPRMRGGPWRKGLVYAAVVWLLNAAVVLPLTGEGFAGSAHLTMAGMVWFAAAHTLFFVLLAVLYAGQPKSSKRARR
jgi:hypothetical protein